MTGVDLDADPNNHFNGMGITPRAISTIFSRAGAQKDEKGSFEGSNTVTVFAPTNHAFEQLPKKLMIFLFSPFGTHILRKLLQYHIVPGVVFHTGKCRRVPDYDF